MSKTSKSLRESKLESTLVGVAGEYFVAAELTRLGHLASITLRNSRGVDILATHASASRSVSIQVKASADDKPEWILTKASESFVSDRHFYVFVNLKGTGERPDYFVVPSRDVAEQIAESHRRWLDLRKRDGTRRKDSSMRKFRDPEGRFSESWERLGLS